MFLFSNVVGVSFASQYLWTGRYATIMATSADRSFQRQELVSWFMCDPSTEVPGRKSPRCNRCFVFHPSFGVYSYQHWNEIDRTVGPTTLLTPSSEPNAANLSMRGERETPKRKNLSGKSRGTNSLTLKEPIIDRTKIKNCWK